MHILADVLHPHPKTPTSVATEAERRAVDSPKQADPYTRCGPKALKKGP